MLVLSRKLNETILIGEEIKITLLGIDGDKIKIGIDAPKDIKVFREELLEATKSTNKQALAAPVVSFDLTTMRKTMSDNERIEEKGKTQEANGKSRE